MRTNDTAADDNNLPRSDARHATEQHATAAAGPLQRDGAHLDRHAAGDFAHRRQQRQPAAIVGDGLVGNRGAAALEQSLGLRRIGREVQVREQDLPFAQHRAFRRLRLLHLDHHVGRGKHRARVGQHFGTRLAVAVVVATDASAGAALHQHIVAVVRGFTHRRRRHAHAVLVILDFRGHADSHRRGSFAGAHRDAVRIEEAADPRHGKPEVCARFFEYRHRIGVESHKPAGARA